jgi:hypothetical protein
MGDVSKIGKYNTTSDESTFIGLVDRLQNYEFKVAKKVITTDESTNLALYNIKWYEERLNLLETLADGEVTIGNRI